MLEANADTRERLNYATRSKCGAVTAACSGEKMPTANLQAMVDQIDPAVMKVKVPRRETH